MRFCTVLLLILVVGRGASAADPVGKLVDQLGDRDFIVRDAASRELAKRGPAALPALRAALTAGNPEAARRAAALIAAVTDKQDHDRVVAATPHALDATADPLGDVLAGFRPHRATRLRVAGPPELLTKPVTLRFADVPFWTALERVSETAGVTFDYLPFDADPPTAVSADLRDTLAKWTRRKNQMEVEIFAAAEVVVARAEDVEKWLTLVKSADGAAARMAFKEMADEAAVKYRQAKDDLAERERRLANLSKPLLPGTIIVAPLAGLAAPSCASAAVRIRAISYPGRLTDVPASELPVVLSLSPEPDLIWSRTGDTTIARAVTPDGTELAVVANPAEPGAAFPGDAFQSLVRFQRPAGKPVTRLATLEGTVRATVWTEPEVLAETSDLMGIPATGKNAVRLSATLAPTDTRGEFDLRGELRYRSGDVRIPAPPRAEKGGRGRADGWQGLNLTDADGNGYELTAMTSRNSGEAAEAGPNPWRVLRWTGIARPTKAGRPAPAKLTFTATRRRDIELPFKLTDVPVSAGTGN